MSEQSDALRLAEKLSSYSLNSGYAAHCHKAAAELRRLHAEVEALRADAERYRWLRDHACTAPTIGPIRMDSKWSLNAAIDAARGKE